MRTRRGASRGSMRKYYQAILLVTAVVSLVSLLIYRHEYNKLRYVLEVFNYFGSKTADANCTHVNSTFAAFDPRFDEPIPSWQRLEDDLYIYSVYNINYRTLKEIRAIGLGTVNSVSNVQCLVFFESESKPVLGSLKFVPIGKLVLDVDGFRYRGYHFVCAYTSGETPTGITFVTKSNKYLDYAPIFPVRSPPRSASVSGGMAVCVTRSSTRPMRSIDMASFVGFHTLIGMDNFVVYDSGVPSAFNARLKELSRDPSSPRRFTYTVIPWNFPFVELERNVMREIVETDCLYRTYNSVAYAVVLAWNEYVVPKFHRATSDLLEDLKRTVSSYDRYRMRSATYCTQQADDERYVNSTLTILRKTGSVNEDRGERPAYVYQPREVLQAELQNSRIVSTKEIGRSLVTVNRYKYCDSDERSQETGDSTILRFAQDIENSWILRKYRDAPR